MPAQTTTPVSGKSGVTEQSTETMRTVTSSEEALLAEEKTRIRMLAFAGLGINAVALAGFTLVNADPFARRCFVVGVLLHLSASASFLWVLEDPRRYRDRYLVPIWCLATLGLLTVLIFFGVMSVAATALLLGLYVSSRSHSQRVAVSTWAFTAVGYLVLSVGLATGVLPDVGILGSPGDDPTHLWFAQVLGQALLWATLVMGRRTHNAMVAALGELNQAVRSVAQRDAALDELRQDYRRALKIGGPGRLTGATLGSFELGPILGRGGMGDVYEAVRTTDGSRAAVKVLGSEGARRPEIVQRFLREIRAVTTIESENIVRILEVGPPDEIPFIAMEYLVGRDLSRYLREHGRLELEEVIDLVRQVGRGLAAAHGTGMVHRDIKPQNLFRVDPTGDGVPTWKLLDFGVSKLGGTDGTLTRGAVVGTPSYMAPEQALGMAVDHRADIYALGAVAYRCLVGVPAFRGRGRDASLVIMEVVGKMPRQPSSLASVSSIVDDVLLVALAKEPEDRFDSAEAFARALEDAQKGVESAELEERAARIAAGHPWG